MNNESLPANLILASGSQYRKLLLKRLGLPFKCQPPNLDETPLDGEGPAAQVA
ncbi:MAG: Maf family protein, partial [Xanthomonadales bacterium]|nr:Maf family protein [Xanthomonadales bacterium]